MNRFRVSLAGTIVLLLVTCSPLMAFRDNLECNWCDRGGMLAEFVNLHAPDIEKDRQTYIDCYESLIPADNNGSWDDPSVKIALEQCSHLDWKNKYSRSDQDYMPLNSVGTRLREIIQTGCFGMLPDSWDPAKTPQAEYFFTGSFEKNLESTIMIEPDHFEPDGYPVKSRMTLNLFFDGEPRELVKSWTTLSPRNTTRSNYARMFDKDDSPIRQSRPIDEILWDFERTPRSCEIEKPPGNEVFPNENIKLDITRFRDQIDRKSREFNRIVVKADRGEILNGAEAGVLESRKAFKVGDGVVTIEYEAPEECGEDTILVYNSCDIKHKLPLAATSHRDVIGQLNVDVACYDVTLSVTKKVSVTGYKEEVTAPSGWKERKRSIEKRDKEQATVIMGLQFDSVADMWVSNELWAYYKPKRVKLSSFSVDLMNKSYTYGNDNHDDGFETTVKRTGRISGGKKVETPSVEMVALIYDRQTKKPKRVVIVIHDIRYELDRTYQLNSRRWSNNPPPPVNEKKTSVTKETFQLSPVMESSEDPATGMEIYPDFDITSGDGVNTFGGGGSLRYTYACHNFPDACDHEQIYNWKLTRTKKKNK